MRRLLVWTVLLAAVPTMARAQPKFPPDPDPSKIQVLILTGQNVGEHLWRQTTPLLKQILEDTKKFEVRVIEEVRGVGPETFANYDLLVMNYYNRTAKEKWGERTEQAFVDFVRSGKGLVLYHVSIASFDGWAEFEQMSGGNWRPSKGLGQHSDPHDFTVDIKDHDHPVTRGLKSFPIKKDELYANLQWQPANTYHVLATAWDDHALYKGKATQPTPGAGLDQPILWVSDFGKGRVFHTSLGHFADAVRNLGFGVTFARGAEWAATGKVTLPIPPEMAAEGSR